MRMAQVAFETYMFHPASNPRWKLLVDLKLLCIGFYGVNYKKLRTKNWLSLINISQIFMEQKKTFRIYIFQYEASIVFMAEKLYPFIFMSERPNMEKYSYLIW